MSLEVVINGPVAMAGSMPLLCKNNGVKVPITPAATVTVTSEIAMAIEVRKSPFQNQVNNNSITANIVQFKSASSISLKTLWPILPLTSSLAIPCTTIAEDCTPTLPAIAAISGVKKNKMAYF